jgi:hypothetical protein
MRAVTIEAESPDDPNSLFRVQVDGELVGETLTAAQAHILLGEILEKAVLPVGSNQARRRPQPARVNE